METNSRRHQWISSTLVQKLHLWMDLLKYVPFGSLGYKLVACVRLVSPIR